LYLSGIAHIEKGTNADQKFFKEESYMDPEITNFKKIKQVNDLIIYLDDSANRLKNRDYLYHYTTIQKAMDMIERQICHLGNAKYMNDQLEYENGDKERWTNIFFASFMTDVKESIGMWSMYSQPWEEGVLLMIPKKVAIDWVRETKEIFEVSSVNKKITGRSIKIDADNKLFLSSVAYSNCDNPDGEKKITWSNVSNTSFSRASHIPQLTGYIKDSAWDYEREIRIKATFGVNPGFKRVAIKIPDEVINTTTIITSPLFDELANNKRLPTKINRSKSIFHNKLKIKSVCSECSYKKNTIL
jgi:hypothetical protein